MKKPEIISKIDIRYIPVATTESFSIVATIPGINISTPVNCNMTPRFQIIPKNVDCFCCLINDLFTRLAIVSK